MADEPLVVALEGVVDTQTVDRATTDLLRVSPTVESALIDMREVRSIDLVAIDALVDGARALRQQGVEVRIAPSWAESVFRLTGRWAVRPSIPASA